MQQFPPLAALGERVVILGPSNAGKSTLCLAIAERIGAPAIHLDQYQHLPNTDWVSRPEAEFVALHDGAILGENWVMDGNYSRLLPQRLARATGAIVIASNRWLRFGRYLRRTLLGGHRPGNLPGAKDSLKWDMVGWVLNRNGQRYFRIIGESGLPHVFCRTACELNALYAAWGLQRR